MCKTLSEGNENQVQTKILQNLTNYITYLFQMLKKVNQTKYFFIDFSKLLLVNDDNRGIHIYIRKSKTKQTNIIKSKKPIQMSRGQYLQFK